MLKNTQKNGFTLVEALIVIVIMGTLVGVGFAGYREFSRRQQLDVVVRSLLSDIRFAQKSASSGDKTPSGCSGILDGYVITPTGCGPSFSNCTGYSIRIHCGGIVSVSDQKAITLPLSVRLAAPGLPTGGILFKSLENGTNISSLTGVTFTLSSTDTGISKSVIILPTGEVQQ